MGPEEIMYLKMEYRSNTWTEDCFRLPESVSDATSNKKVIWLSQALHEHFHPELSRSVNPDKISAPLRFLHLVVLSQVCQHSRFALQLFFDNSDVGVVVPRNQLSVPDAGEQGAVVDPITQSMCLRDVVESVHRLKKGRKPFGLVGWIAALKEVDVLQSLVRHIEHMHIVHSFDAENYLHDDADQGEDEQSPTGDGQLLPLRTESA